MQGALYFLIAIAATTVGAMTGMGGGVIIKPVLDVLGQYDVETISMLSCLTVFAMSLVSAGKHVRQKTPLNLRLSLPLAIGSLAGGSLGAHLLSALVTVIGSDAPVLICQNIVLGLLILAVFLYMQNKASIRPLGRTGLAASLLVGVALGFFSSFLGIGGGPINVAAIMFVFGVTIKPATVCSLVTILFAQVSKLVTTGMSIGFAGFDFSMLPFMIIGAVLGGFLGAKFNKELSDRAVERSFNAVQLIVLGICLFNIVRYTRG